MGYLVLAGVVFGVNLLPAFGPPTWSVLVFFRLQSSLAAVPLVLIGALAAAPLSHSVGLCGMAGKAAFRFASAWRVNADLFVSTRRCERGAAASGRLLLAYGSRRFRRRLSQKRIDNLEAVRDAVGGSRRRAAAGLGLFALSPVPSAQLFVAAGLLDAPLVPLTAAFFAGRLVSYSIYVAAASAAKHSLGSIIQGAFTSPTGIALQVLMLASLVALLRLDWARLLTRRRGFHRGEPHPVESTRKSSLDARHSERARTVPRTSPSCSPTRSLGR